jgi:mycothiol synthase
MIPPGYEVRPARREDQMDIASLIRRYDVRDGAVSDFGADDLIELWHRPRLDMERDTWLVTCEGSVAGYAMFWHTDPNKVLNGFAVVDPDHFRKGIGTFLVQSIRARVGEMATDIGAPLTLRLFGEITDPAALELLHLQGMTPVRRHFTMLMDLSTAVGLETEPPYRLELRTCQTEEDARTAHAVFEESFTEHWGHVAESFEEWSAGVMSRGDYDPSLWWIAFEGDEPAGVLISQITDDLGWVAILGVLKPWRGRGLGAAMLRTAFLEFRNRGLKQAGLGVDAANETRAVALYERVGMHVAKGYESFEQVIEPA